MIIRNQRLLNWILIAVSLIAGTLLSCVTVRGDEKWRPVINWSYDWVDHRACIKGSRGVVATFIHAYMDQERPGWRDELWVRSHVQDWIEEADRNGEIYVWSTSGDDAAYQVVKSVIRKNRL